MNTILLVDDDPLFTRSLINNLSGEFDVMAVDKAEVAADAVASHSPEIILVDYKLRNENGVHLVRQLRKTKAFKGGILLMTGYGDFELCLEALQAGVDSIVGKPIDLDNLQTTIHRTLQYRRQLLHYETIVSKDEIKKAVIEVQQHEITKFKNLLQITHQRFDTIFNGVSDPVVILDANLNVISVNKAGALLNLDTEFGKIYGNCKHCKLRAMPGPGQAEHDAPMAKHLYNLSDRCPAHRALESHQPTHENILDRKTKKVYQVTAYPILNEENEARNIIEFRRDITETAILQQNLFAGQKKFIEMRRAAEIGHEVNNFLSVINGYVQIAMEITESEKVLQTLNQAKDGIVKLTAFSKQLMSRDHHEQSHKKIEIVPFLNALIDFIKNQELFNSISFIRQWKERDLIIKADEIQIQEVFINLMKNAAEAMKNGSIILNAVRDDDGKNVRVLIGDTGPGLPEAVVHEVFHSGVTTKEDGHGIGLPLIKKLVEQNQGAIRLVSTSGNGTEFELTFPLVSASYDSGNNY